MRYLRSKINGRVVGFNPALADSKDFELIELPVPPEGDPLAEQVFLEDAISIKRR